ncbi:AMP-binding protein [Kribbella sp. NBC_01245]|uniref:AMP-binding protein n=1 Tax=Kribbella sp. NBC_01245 TaxID=2903578 RepID=UPI002E2BE901|nr:AMP-binding protein [Kribbella sp. NBC_01245]
MNHPSTERSDVCAVAFARDLASYGDQIAVITTDGSVTFRDLAARVAATADRLGPERRLVLLAGGNHLDALVVYLAALAAGHPLLLVPGDSPESTQSLIGAYDPDVVVRPTCGPNGARWEIDERRPVSAHRLHPDLALLLSTSGSTGSPKLVRLSHENLQANAESIASYLGIRSTDRAATTLPMHYCYGLSVVNSHLLRGAALILTDLSVSTEAFWQLFREAGGSTFAGVPYTFDLLERVGFAEMDLPRLRYVTQAGGRLAAERVAGLASLGRRKGWDLYVMYGQTEATARMAYLPPDLAASHPQAIGRAIPGGSFRLEPLPDSVDGVGELVYAGPNVMLGYAETPADLAEGRTIHELRTGDLARLRVDGLYEIVGRRSRFAKVFGLRIDPQQVEAALEVHGYSSCCLGEDDELVVVVEGEAEADEVRRLAAAACGLPVRAVRVQLVDAFPRLDTGKLDYRAIGELASDRPAEVVAAGATVSDLCRLYAELLDRSDVTPDSSFVSLGGDSLSYVEVSVRLEEAIGRLPTDWHSRPIRDLAEPAAPIAGRRRIFRMMETGVALRAIAIVLIVGSHIQLFQIKGGAHLLLTVVGYNFARFHLTSAVRRDRIRYLAQTVARIAVPSMAWVAVALFISTDYHWENLFLLNSVVVPDDNGPGMYLWFVETVVYLLILVAVALCVPAFDRLERRFSFGLPITIATIGLVTRYDLLELDARNALPSIVTVFWLFALGWAAAKGPAVWQRVLVTIAAAITVPGFFPGELMRESIIVVGFALLVWVPRLPSLGPLTRVAGVLASSSLYIYVTHWQIYPHIAQYSDVLALFGALAFGIAYAALTTKVLRLLSSTGRSVKTWRLGLNWTLPASIRARSEA